MEENPEDTITEEREELMISPSGKNPTRRLAHFLKPSVTSIEGPVFHLPSGTFLSPTSTDFPLRVEFKGCFGPARLWKSWFDRMHSIHQSTWKKAGIYEAIVNSTYQIRVNREIVLGFAEKWCSDTNTFVFDWGEGTVTLEDVLVLGGYSVLGKSVITPLENREMVEIDAKLMKGRSELLKSKANKADQTQWGKLFMGSGSEIEHEAFLVLWLSRHVFPCGHKVINRDVHSIAIHLARGTRIALAPAVLSWLYRDLRRLRLKKATLSKRKRKAGLSLWAPLQMVQIWAWERFPTLRPQPNPLKPGEPRMARWNKMKTKNIENVGMALNSARECFQWRPYAISEENWVFPKFYIEREEWVSVCLGMDEDFELFARFLRPSELVGLDCLECYLPHRVAMQFGMDQDLPGLVSRLNETPVMAWEKYNRPIKDGRLYVPSRLFKSDVTTRYLEWWKQSKLAQKDAVKGAKAEKSTKSPRKPPEVPKGKNVENDALGTPTKRERFKPAKLRHEKSIINSQVKSLQIPKGKKRKRVDKEPKSVGKDKHRLGDSAGKKKSCAADNGAGKKMEYQVEHRENTMRGEAMMGGSHGPSENVIESHVGIPSDDWVSIGNNGRYIGTQSAVDVPGLEARASKLETVFARLKAEKLGLRAALHISDIASNKKPLDWNTPMEIAEGAARGLEYLHETANPPVIYRNFKASNILPDGKFNMKLSEFGLAKLGPTGDKSHVSINVTGTYGYKRGVAEGMPFDPCNWLLLSVKDNLPKKKESQMCIALELTFWRSSLEGESLTIQVTRPSEEQNLVSWIVKTAACVGNPCRKLGRGVLQAMALGGVSTQTSHHCKQCPPLSWLSTSRPGPSSMGSHSSFSLWVSSRKALYRDCSCRLPIARTFSSISGFSRSLKVKQSSSCNIMSSSGEYRHYPTDSSWKLEVLSGAGNPCARMVPNLSGHISSDREPVSCSPQLTKEENDIMSSRGECRHYPTDSSWKLEVLSGAGNPCVRMVPNLSGHITSDREPDPQLMEQENEQVLEDKAARLWIEEAFRLVKEKYELRDSNTPVFVHSNHNPVGFGIPRVEATANGGQYGLTDMQDGSDHLLSKDRMEASMVSANSSREGTLRSSLGQGYMHSQAHTSGACSVENEGNTSLIEKSPVVQSEGIEYNGSGGLSKEMEEKTSKPLSGSSIDKPKGFDQFHVRERLVRIYEKVAKIDVKQETPVDHGEMICFSIYSGPEADFGNGKSCIWVDLLAEGGKTILAEFAPFFEDTSIKKAMFPSLILLSLCRHLVVWHNYSFDNHIIENYGFKVSGFHADTMHMARLWDSSRQTEGGYSLEALSGDPRVCHDENLIGKVSMKTIFGRGKVKKDGSNGKIITIPPVEDLQREERKLWICYSALDSISTLNLYESLKRKLSGMEWKVDGRIEGTMLDFYEKYWQPFGELLVTMETEGMLVDRSYLAEVEKVARAEQQVAGNRFRNWASKYCPDAKYMNVGSDTQLRLLLFGGTLNSKDQNESLPLEKDFKVPNIEKVIEEGKKAPTKFRNIKLCRLESKLEPEMYTASGWPSVCGDALKTLAGKVSAEFDFTDEAQVLETKEGVSEDKEAAYGTAYAAFGGGLKGKEACHAIAALCEVCSIDSLISNFILPLQGSHISGKNGRIHGSLNINTETGRLSARRPSLQNQPALEKDRYKIRQAFVAAPGNSLIVADYGQLELRILAHLANCKSMLDAFKAGGDFHSRTAMNMYPHIREAVEQKSVLLEWHPQPGEDKPPVPLLKDAFASERRKAKMLNFSIAYGKTAVGLSRDWKVSVKEAKETVARWYNERKEVRNWQDERKKEACSTKRCVHTLLGRARLFPSVDQVTSSQRGHIERAAINTPVQGSAADVAMCAMLEISKNLRLKELGWRLLLQVHDEVILEGPTESGEEAKAIVVECMSKPFDGKNILRVDLSVDAKCAQNWIMGPIQSSWIFHSAFFFSLFFCHMGNRHLCLPSNNIRPKEASSVRRAEFSIVRRTGNSVAHHLARNARCISDIAVWKDAAPRR
ncbi:hypothetical protein RHMOL_Rhmol06G0295500 [Rhododendron molle]|uniref:Uncharacterized protein n=1 Tax=Rhododendron molle TaxID=49168 RepID=A0ACC0NHP3_RHOML|nr:hypothetical protein RHMOL_Rhmol06G0295500 [Rhododendron molle]